MVDSFWKSNNRGVSASMRCINVIKSFARLHALTFAAAPLER